MNEGQHDAVVDLLGAFVLDAVDEDERAMITGHLDTCPICRAEVDDHLEIAAMFSSGGPAPARIWSEIEASLTEEAPVIPLFEASSERRRRRSRRAAATAIAVAAALVLFALLGTTVIDQRNRLDDLSSEVAAAQEADVLSELLGDPNTVVADLTNARGDLTARAVLGQDGDSFVLGETLPELLPGRTYQLWALLENDPVSVGLLGRDPSLEPFHVDGPVRALMITDEPAGGVEQPTSVALVQAEIT